MAFNISSSIRIANPDACSGDAGHASVRECMAGPRGSDPDHSATGNWAECGQN